MSNEINNPNTNKIHDADSHPVIIGRDAQQVPQKIGQDAQQVSEDGRYGSSMVTDDGKGKVEAPPAQTDQV